MPTHIKELLPHLLPADQSWKVTLLAQWQSIVGNLKAHVTLLKITDDTITLGVFNSSWLQEMYLLSPVILETINKSLDQPRIKNIRFKQIAQKKKGGCTPSFKRITAVAPLSLSREQEAALCKINDPELRIGLFHFLQRCNREKE
ncbi:MAG TPA: DUF721 domain-containing protein [Candidatus Babeliales bacterium]|nr:DUF721 domain-containing protein [Candidatus Babeliales bacterium]